MTNNNPPKFQAGGGLPEWSRASLPSAQQVHEADRAASLPSAMNAGRLMPEFTPVSSPAPFPSDGMSQPGVTGAPRLPAGPRI
jgi:hypothetical protein